MRQEKRKKRRKKGSLSNMKENRIKMILSLFILVLWVCFIFRNSSEVAEVSSQRSGALAAFLMNILSEHVIRKIAHLFEYTVLGILLINFVSCFKTCFKGSDDIMRLRGNSFIQVICSALAGLVTASIDEFIQLNTDGRSAQISDILLDFMGVLAGLTIFFILTKIVFVIKSKKTHIS